MAMQLLIKARIKNIAQLTEDIRSFDLVPVKRPTWPAMSGGDHVIVHLPNGRVRRYSICSDPADCTLLRIAVLRKDDSRGGSSFLHDDAQEGDSLFVSYPQNNFSLVKSPGQHIFIAGGIGITPFISMAYEARRNGSHVQLHYCVRDRDRAVFSTLLRELLGEENVILHSSRTGRLNVARALSDCENDSHIYCCGPASLHSAVMEAGGHLYPERLHFESFGTVPPDGVFGEPFEVVLASSGQKLSVPSTTRLLDVLREAGQDIPADCEAGVCGTCVVPFSSGLTLHADSCLRPEQRKEQIASCVSRAVGTIIINL